MSELVVTETDVFRQSISLHSDMKIRDTFKVILISLAICHCVFASDEEQSNSLKEFPENGKFYVSVFNCKVELPTEYVLNTKDQGHFLFVKKSGGIGRISIGAYDDSIKSSDELEIVKQQEMGGLAVLFVTAKWHPSESVIIHDDHYAITVIGDGINIWKGIVQSCVDTRVESEETKTDLFNQEEKR